MAQFAINTNIVQTNIVNLGFVVGVLVYFGKDTISSILQQRRSKIVESITSAEDRYTQAEVRLQQAESEVQQANQKACEIRSQGDQQVEAAKQTLKQQAVTDIQELQKSSNASLNLAHHQVLQKIQKRVTQLALQKAEAKLFQYSDQATHATVVEYQLSGLW
jgi:F-type H+-transporting ATPase subunit b